jgi:hypothetical protein
MTLLVSRIWYRRFGIVGFKYQFHLPLLRTQLSLGLG